MQAEIFELLFNSAEIAKFTPEEIVKYERDMTTERDIRNQIAYSREEGLAEGLEKGRAEGLAEGIAEGKAEVAKALKSMGFDADVILQSTGVNPDDLKESQGRRTAVPK